jgi:hypothetical protein
MRHEARWTSQAVPALLRALSLHLRNNGAAVPESEALAAAVRAWADADLQRQQQDHPQDAPVIAQHERGYRWKTLFLPHATQLRLECSCGTFYAEVVGDDIVFQGRSVSPRGKMVAAVGEGRNAWRDMWLRLPGSPCWKRARICRLEHERELERRQLREQELAMHPPTPADGMAAAAASMAAALKTTLALVERCTEQARSQLDRRARRHRRDSDRQGEACAFD